MEKDARKVATVNAEEVAGGDARDVAEIFNKTAAEGSASNGATPLGDRADDVAGGVTANMNENDS